MSGLLILFLELVLSRNFILDCNLLGKECLLIFIHLKICSVVAIIIIKDLRLGENFLDCLYLYFN